MTECCGEVRSTPFCPLCGRKLRGNSPLLELLAHCRAAERGQRTIVTKSLRKSEAWKSDEEKVRFYARRADRAEESATRWKTWGDALAELLAREVPTP
jgi:hypothetical protein